MQAKNGEEIGENLKIMIKEKEYGFSSLVWVPWAGLS